MSDPVSLASLFDAAEQAAIRGDFAAAARLLGEAARAQEAALGPDHLDLANTLNNLAVAHERCGQLDAAEREYRRAYAIAARTRPADNPFVTTSAQNLREFCQANGRPMDVPPSAMSLAPDSHDPVTIVLKAAPATAASPAQADVPTQRIEPLPMTLAAEPSPPGPRPDARPPDTSPRPVRAGSKPVQSPAPSMVPAPARTSEPRPAAVVAAPAAREGFARPGRAAAPRVDSRPRRVRRHRRARDLAGRGTPSRRAAGGNHRRRLRRAVRRLRRTGGGTQAAPVDAPRKPQSAPAPRATAASPAPATATAAGVTIGDAQLCTSLSSSYRCDAAGSTVRPGRLVFYTRLIADHDTSVVHRWYRGNELRQSLRLQVPARRQGFRTFSRATVSASEGEWRVELRTRDGQTAAHRTLHGPLTRRLLAQGRHRIEARRSDGRTAARDDGDERDGRDGAGEDQRIGRPHLEQQVLQPSARPRRQPARPPPGPRRRAPSPPATTDRTTCPRLAPSAIRRHSSRRRTLTASAMTP